MLFTNILLILIAATISEAFELVLFIGDSFVEESVTMMSLIAVAAAIFVVVAVFGLRVLVSSFSTLFFAGFIAF